MADHHLILEIVGAAGAGLALYLLAALNRAASKIAVLEDRTKRHANDVDRLESKIDGIRELITEQIGNVHSRINERGPP